MAYQFDYESIKQRIITNLLTKSEHQEVLDDSAVIALVEAVSQENEDSMSNSEYHTYENNWMLARNKSSLLTESKIHGYKVPRKIGASGLVKVGMDENFSTTPTNQVVFPKYTQFSNGDIIFSSIAEEVLTTGSTSANISVVQGIPKSETFTALGTESENFIVNNNSIENQIYSLEVNSEEWTEVTSIFDYGPFDKVYELETIPDFSGVRIRTGDGVTGIKLSSGDIVEFNYLETRGGDGNVLVQGSVTEVVDSVFNTLGDKVDVFCTNDNALSGGKSEASIDEIRNKSPQVFQTGDRAGGKIDYEAIISDLSFIKKVSVWGAYEYALDNGLNPWQPIPLQDNLVQIVALSTSDQDLTNTEQETLIETINPIKPPEDIINYNPLEVVSIGFEINAVANRSFTLNQVKNNIQSALANTYNIDELNFKQGISESEYIALIQGAKGVKSHSTNVEFIYDTTFGLSYATDITLPTYPLDGTSLKIYVKLKSEDTSLFELAGIGDASGNIIGQGSYTFTSSQIVPTTGEGAIAITTGLSGAYTNYDVRVVYETLDDNIVLPKRTQILDYLYSNVVLNY